jgi:hypothetical protein
MTVRRHLEKKQLEILVPGLTALILVNAIALVIWLTGAV